MQTTFDTESIVRRINELIDYILLNAFAVDLSGLYEGKAGISFALMESAQKLNNNYFADMATKLLMQSILTTATEYDLYNGLSGIGYVIKRLERDQLLEIDFNEVFGRQHHHICSSLEQYLNNGIPQSIESLLECCYYLNLFHTKKEQFLKQQIINRSTNLICSQLDSFSSFPSSCTSNKKEFLQLLQKYVICVYINKNSDKKTPVIFEKYIALYHEGTFAWNSELAYYVGLNDPNYFQIDLKNILEIGTFDQIINYLSICLNLFPIKAREIILRMFVDINIDELGKWISLTCPSGFSRISYGHGISRLILLLLRIISDEIDTSDTLII